MNQKIALAKGLTEKNDLKSDFFGELGAMRHAATHNHCIATSKVEEAKLLPFFKQGDLICITPEKAELIFRVLDNEVGALFVVARAAAPTEPTDEI